MASGLRTQIDHDGGFDLYRDLDRPADRESLAFEPLVSAGLLQSLAEDSGSNGSQILNILAPVQLRRTMPRALSLSFDLRLIANLGLRYSGSGRHTRSC